MRQWHLVTVCAGASPIDDDKIADLAKCDQSVMPCPSAIVDALPGLRQKRPQVSWLEVATRCNNDQIRIPRKRDERLTTEWMTLHHRHFKRESPWLSSEDVNQGFPMLFCDVDISKIMIMLGGAVIDRKMVGALRGDHLPELGKCGTAKFVYFH